MINSGSLITVFVHVAAISATQKIPPVYVINVSVLIIIDSIARDLARITPQYWLQVFMGSINSGINNTYNYRCAF